MENLAESQMSVTLAEDPNRSFILLCLAETQYNCSKIDQLKFNNRNERLSWMLHKKIISYTIKNQRHFILPRKQVYTLEQPYCESGT